MIHIFQFKSCFILLNDSVNTHYFNVRYMILLLRITNENGFLSGSLYDAGQSYMNTFYFSAAAFVLSSLSLVFFYVQRWCLPKTI